jgi:hypothetical protein
LFFVAYNISLKRLYPKVPHLKWQVLKTVYACLLPCEDLVISKGVWSDILGSSYFPFLFEILLHFQSGNKVAVSKDRKCRKLYCCYFTNTVWIRARLCKLQKGCTRLAAASDKVYQLFAHGR